MTVRIRGARREDAREVAELLHAHMNRKIPVERWLRLFSPPWPWPAEFEDIGAVAEDGGEIVGFVARILAERTIGGRREVIGNMSGWYLRKEYRGSGLGVRLFEYLIETRRGATLTSLTISAPTLPLYDKWGWDTLDSHRLLWRRGLDGPEAEITTDVNEVRARASGEQRRLLDDHAGFPLLPVWVRCEGREGLLVLSEKRKGESHRLFLDLLHGADPDLLAAAAPAIADRRLPETEPEAVFAADERFLDGRQTEAERVAAPVPRRFVSDSLRAADVDFLYCEIPLLDLKVD